MLVRFTISRNGSPGSKDKKCQGWVVHFKFVFQECPGAHPASWNCSLDIVTSTKHKTHPLSCWRCEYPWDWKGSGFHGIPVPSAAPLLLPRSPPAGATPSSWAQGQASCTGGYDSHFVSLKNTLGSVLDMFNIESTFNKTLSGFHSTDTGNFD